MGIYVFDLEALGQARADDLERRFFSSAILATISFPVCSLKANGSTPSLMTGIG